MIRSGGGVCGVAVVAKVGVVSSLVPLVPVAALCDVDSVAEQVPAQVAGVGGRLPGQAQPRSGHVVEAGAAGLQRN